jgi:hypothetical protein
MAQKITPFTVCTFNVGTDENDYRNIHQGDAQQLKSDYNNAQRATSTALKDQADVYCLQEVWDLSRPIVQFLAHQQFECVRHGTKRFDAAIFINTNRFREIQNHSFIDNESNTDIAVATAIDIQTSQKVAFVSAHVPGFKWSNVNNDSLYSGNKACEAIAKRLQDIGPCALQVIGADMNANSAPSRFECFTNTGFRVHTSEKTTNKNISDEPHDRSLDYLLIKTGEKTSSYWEKFISWFSSTFNKYENTQSANNKGFTFNHEQHASDHLPVFIEIQQKFSMSLLSWAWSLFTWK